MVDPKDLLNTNSLIDRARSGDERAIDQLYTRYIARVEAWTRGRVPRHARHLEDTHTVAHDVLVKSLLKVADAGIRSSFRAYVSRAVRNRLADLGKSRRWLQEELDDQTATDAPTELESLLEREFESRLLECVDQLPRESREMLHLRFERGLGYAEIADALRLSSEDAARMRINRAVSALRSNLESLDHEDS